MRALILDALTQARIEAAIVEARAKPKTRADLERHALPDRALISLADRGGRGGPSGVPVAIPRGYLAAFSFEDQPAGLCRHLSISVDTPGSMPSLPAVTMIAKAFGMEFPFTQQRPGNLWLEEFEPGQQAINIVQREKDLSNE